MDRFLERVEPGYFQGFSVEHLLFEQKSEHQHLIIFENRQFGRVMTLDGVVQTTERDEFIYHEMISHVPLLAHPAPRCVLIIGGGDGGTLRETLRHDCVERVVQVEIDAEVIEMCKTYLPGHSRGAFEDPRVEIVIDDGFKFVRDSLEHFDVIITDSTDAVGPGAILFSFEYYAACYERLTEGGVLVTQNGTAFFQMNEVRPSFQHLSRLFRDAHFYGAAVPTYVGGLMMFGWATDDVTLRRTSKVTLTDRFSARALATRYYTPEIHQASFALPRYVLEAIGA